MTRTHHISNDELIVMKFSISPDQEGKLTGQLVTRSGNTDLYALQCPDFKTECKLTKDMINNKNKKIFRSENEIGIDEVNIDVQKCKEGCYMLFGIYSRNSSTDFSLTTSFEDKSHIHLENNEAVYAYVRYNHFDYYSFYIPDDLAEQVEKISFQLTSYSGDADLFISRKEPYPNRENSENVSQNEYYMSDTIIINEQPFDGNYYVSVKGASSSYYALLYRIDIKTEKPNESNIITLIDGLPQSFSMKNGDVALNFTFKVYSKQNFDIVLTPERGKFKMYLDFEKKKTLELHRWTGSTFIHVDSTERGFVSNKYYILRVAQQLSFTDIFSSHKFKFSLVFKTSKKCSMLEASMPTYGEVNHDEYSFYVFPIVKANLNVTISLTDYTGDPNLIVSLHQNNKYPSVDNYDFISSNIGNDNLLIEWKNIVEGNKECANDNSNCMIYMSVYTSNEHSDYLLLASYSLWHTFVPLIDGMPIEDQCQDQNIYYIIGSNYTTILHITKNSGDLDIYIGQIDVSTNPNKQNWIIPNNKTYTQKPTLKANVFSAKLNSCSSCAYLINITPKENTTSISSFTIIYTIFEAEYLQEGVQTINSVGNNQYVYYEFYSYCGNCTLSISITPITNGNPDLYVLFGEDIKPSHINYHFKSNSPAGDFLQITPNDTIFKTQDNGIQGTYIIGVYGQKECTFSIMAMTSKNNLITLANGIPYTIRTVPSSPITISYQHTTAASISVTINMLYGDAYILANVCEDPTAPDVMDHIPTDKSFAWSSKDTYNPSSLIIESSHPNFKKDALYLISIISSTESIYTVVLSDYSSITIMKFNEPMRIHMMKQTLMVSFVPDENIDIEIIPTVFSGSFAYYLLREPTDNYTNAIASANSCCGSILFKSTDKQFNKSNTYYISIVGEKKDTDFNLLLSIKQGIINLMDGSPLAINLTQHNPKALFGYNGYFTANVVSINVQASSPIIVYISRIINSKASESDYPTEASHNFKFEYDYLSMSASGMVQLLNTTEQQLVLIGVESQAENSSIEVVAWSRNKVSLLSNTALQGTIYSSSDVHTYEVVVEKSPGYISTSSCGGELLYNIYELALTKKERLSTQATKGYTILLHNGKHYIEVKQGAAESNHIVNYRISFKDNVTNDKIIQNYFPESDDISWNLDNGEIQLLWSPAYFLNSKGKREKINETVTYFLSILPYFIEGNIGACPSFQPVITNMQSTSGTNIKIPFPDIKQDIFYIMIYAYVPKADDYLTYRLVTAYAHRASGWIKSIFLI
jgi:hypothetical protein